MMIFFVLSCVRKRKREERPCDEFGENRGRETKGDREWWWWWPQRR